MTIFIPVVGGAGVVSKVGLSDVPEDEDVLVAVGLHVAVVGRVQQHRVLVPLHLEILC